jgi:queuosine precursor transporter
MGNRNEIVITVATGLFYTAIIGSLPLSVKVHSFDFLGGVLIPTGTILFSLSYLATDVINEVRGRDSAFKVVVVGLLMRAFLALITLFSLDGEALPGITNALFWSEKNEEAFEFILGSSQFIILGGILGFAISSFIDVSIYSHLKKVHTAKNLLWLRNNLSTIVAQIVGTVVFVLIAFSFRMPMSAILPLIVGQIVFKCIFAIVDTPVLYIARNVAEKRPILDFSG